MTALPLAVYSDLLHYAKEHTLSISQMQFYAAELTSALIYLHDNSLIHRDVKSENVLLMQNGHILLGDLGSVSGKECCL